eukprot:m.363802 g.363802  ORF g.363802 m.363802 type:complete len:71 (+) comp24222_c0_seq1:27-239(+)
MSIRFTLWMCVELAERQAVELAMYHFPQIVVAAAARLIAWCPVFPAIDPAFQAVFRTARPAEIGNARLPA